MWETRVLLAARRQLELIRGGGDHSSDGEWPGETISVFVTRAASGGHVRAIGKYVIALPEGDVAPMAVGIVALPVYWASAILSRAARKARLTPATKSSAGQAVVEEPMVSNGVIGS